MLDWFVWKGERCTMHGIHMLVPPDIITPEERVQFVNIPGRSGSVKAVENTKHPVYNELQLSVTCVIDDLTNVDDIIDYLEGTSRVEFANKSGGYYNATIVGQIDLAKVLRGNPHRSFGVTFRCTDPFWHFNDEEVIEFTKNSENNTRTIFNPGNVYSEPIIEMHFFTPEPDTEITGAIAINGVRMSFSFVSEFINSSFEEHVAIMDCITGECYTVSNNEIVKSFRSRVVGDDLPFFSVGNNIVEVECGGINTILIRPNWRKRL